MATISFAGIAVSVVALDITVSQDWTDVEIPLYQIALVGIPIVIIYIIFIIIVIIMLKDALGNASYFKHRASNLSKTVSYFQDLAFNDPITGFPNSRGLEREIVKNKSKETVGNRCLILLDLINFGQINDKHSHWKGDEYLRNFAEMVSTKSRRDEFVFKKRPQIPENISDKKDDENVKTFRKYSGGDEFYILLNGTIIDGLGYLNRLQKRAPEFEQMAFEVLGSEFPFGFHAGLTVVTLNEEYKSLDERSSQCLQLSKDENNPIRLYWNDNELPPIEPNSNEESILNTSKTIFKN
jgi:GGDEF domain-containing protein